MHAGGPSPIPEADKAAVRDNLLEGIVRAPQVVRTQLGECLKSIVQVDFPERWPGLLPIVLQNLSSQVCPLSCMTTFISSARCSGLNLCAEDCTSLLPVSKELDAEQGACHHNCFSRLAYFFFLLLS